MQKSLEQVLESMRNRKKEIVKDGTDNNAIIDTESSLDKIKDALGQLKEIKNQKKCIKIRKTETLQIEEEAMYSMLLPLFGEWLESNKSEIMNQLGSQIKIQDISEDMMRKVVFDAVDEEFISKYINKMLFEYIQNHEDYIKQSIDSIIQHSVKSKLYEVVEDVIHKIMGKK
ncbi:hypothetical protein [Candidatus Cytomitobacter primus]|uniref:Uncharacterized protein n=1 Tax=Candidatus Cytomitobacter primus TaxID=2066024 RepID=A0A5C0UE11_9PROT|nr:hypothetical protein [Candidatus Cytomitobacter primus]QEK38316.1 hypothetical protein FZC34_00025 [Candidatus Cytomitobacter primus]